MGDDIRERIADAISGLPAETRPTWLRDFATQENLLPVLLDSGGFLGIRKSDLRVVAVKWDSPRDLAVVEDARLVNSVLFGASSMFAGLESLRPARSAASKTCPVCNGTGTMNFPTKQAINLRCFCGGLGWVPA